MELIFFTSISYFSESEKHSLRTELGEKYFFMSESFSCANHHYKHGRHFGSLRKYYRTGADNTLLTLRLRGRSSD